MNPFYKSQSSLRMTHCSPMHWSELPRIDCWRLDGRIQPLDRDWTAGSEASIIRSSNARAGTPAAACMGQPMRAACSS
eukprot:COSAG06_NODE_3523_length_5230_cov_3.686245_9_plen_78_part_00